MPATEIGTSERLLEELRLWVEMETPTTDAAAVNRLVDRAEAGLREAGATLERIPGRDGYGDNLIARLPGPAGSNRKPVVVCVHLDTVWETAPSPPRCPSASRATRPTAPASTT